ncbi:siderophore-interacting protein [Massilia sp. Leaf139]|uniref:siderophore-interacting protein n=1 Tax=Massilia sp. Leaf139 TaxID=1736272 RepID=UPI0009EB66BF|nr:siderophore-interacting protein [Massilia sp. Leaf139]
MEHSKRRGIKRVRHELHRRDVVVARVAPLGAHFVAITLHADSLAGFLSLSFDDHVKFMFDDGSGGQVRRDYTPRRFDAQARELTIEFALHGEGAASDWARRARVGDTAVIGGPRGSMIIPMDYDWHLLAGDASALPAMRRRLEELPASARVIVVAAAAQDDRIAFDGAARAEVHWIDDADALAEAVRALPLPGGEGFAWAAGEAGAMRALREVLAIEKALPKEAMRVSAYWKRGVAEHHEQLD